MCIYIYIYKRQFILSEFRYVILITYKHTHTRTYAYICVSVRMKKEDMLLNFNKRIHA